MAGTPHAWTQKQAVHRVRSVTRDQSLPSPATQAQQRLRMKLVAVSVVKNEADIIEAFVRHTHAWVDEHFIFDHASTDGTREILFGLLREGLPLRLFTGTSIANLQQSRSNLLARLAFVEGGADWVLPLDADEILIATNRLELETMLSDGPEPCTVLLRNYSPSTHDDADEVNPVRRIAYRQRGGGVTSKVFVPRAMGLRPDVAAGKGNHALYCQDQAVPTRPLPNVWLAHFALRSPHQQVLRVVTAELQRLSRGQVHEGLDTHYRLGFQLLAEDADLFFSTVLQPAERLHHDPVEYRGGALRYLQNISAFARSARALVPFLERLARSHGMLVDTPTAVSVTTEEIIMPLEASTGSTLLQLGAAEPFQGFVPISGWEPDEGPVPEAFLPRFHWATAPATQLMIYATKAGTARFEAQALSYADQQLITVEINGATQAEHRFERVNQKENIVLTLPLSPGDNHLVLRHRSWIESAADPRKLAVIFLSLRVVQL